MADARRKKKRSVTVWLMWTNNWRTSGEVVKFGTRRVAESDRAYITKYGAKCGPIVKVEVLRG